LVFSHNDLHSLNILQLTGDDKLLIIDYEYSGYNFRGYDLANIFNETIINYNHNEHPYYMVEPKKYPGKKELLDFVKYYLFFSKFDSNYDKKKIMEDDNYFDTYVKENYNYGEFYEEVDALIQEVKVCAMLSHYYWVIWSIVMCKNPTINFDYISYAYDRFQVYLTLKKRFLEKRKKDHMNP